jgi:glycosyltransferase involved in cell wall biosynthesis
MPKYCVVIPTFRGEGRIESAIASVLAQSISDWELIVLDDGSDDQTVESATRGFKGDRRCSVVELAHVGAYAARDEGIRRTSAPYIAFLDDDDAWFPYKLALADIELGRTERHGQVLHHTAVIDVLPDGVKRYRFEPSTVLAGALASDPVATSTAVISQELYEAAGRFDTSLQRFGDWDLWVRAIDVGQLRPSGVATARVTVRDGSLQRSSWREVSDARAVVAERNTERAGDAGIRSQIWSAHRSKTAARAAEAGSKGSAAVLAGRALLAREVHEAARSAAVALCPGSMRALRDLAAIARTR